MDEDDNELDELVQLGQELVYAILEREPLAQVTNLIESGAPLWWQDADGWSALHAAAHVENESLVRLLLEKGAVWNAVDLLGNTAGDVALSLNNEGCYVAIRDAGIRTEMLLSLLADRDDAPPTGGSIAHIVLNATDDTAAGSQDAFLSSKLHFATGSDGQEICLVQAGDEQVGVMMGWERGIMQESVRRLCEDHSNMSQGLNVLNIGFGLGIIDGFFQSLATPPALHLIVEPHPDVLRHMMETGWYDKPNVKIFEGKWQEAVAAEDILGPGGRWDVIYTDTFSEHYKDLRQFFRHVPKLLSGPDARFGFFNGLGATNALFYDVQTQLSELHLAELGLAVEWNDVDVFADATSAERWGETRKYFTQRLYRLPTCRLKGPS